ncbi:ABC transporter ATP-binding protein [Bradyrhizobium yuanmingense]|uniref:ABC transporter ATP-binding protein n=1 Tax=Bradyrhizobium yuanmingense TaxID=108015 RepID=UPI0023B994CB|nr:ABC transporter ATP-binding protein [Bradyrhizobium yuanmingense]MDF0584712.1 ABC transporter ATP-binding protein [Bradyrhizobium yuanmingense]
MMDQTTSHALEAPYVRTFEHGNAGRPAITAGGPPLLSITGLTVVLADQPETRLLDAVQFDLRKGEFFALVGESGSGKSVLCSTIMDVASSELRCFGDIQFEGRPLSHVDRRRRAMIYQQPSLYLNPVRNIGFQLRETIQMIGGLSKREASERAVDLLCDVGIDDPKATMRKYPHEMSGGMNQRVMIAMALAMKPKLLIADEPTSALDVTTQKQILDLLERLRSDMAILFVTHDLGIALQRSDRIGVLYAGQLVEAGRADLVARTPLHPYTRALFSAIPPLSGHPRRLHSPAGNLPEPTQRQAGCNFASRCSGTLDICRHTRPALQGIPQQAVACHNLEA